MAHPGGRPTKYKPEYCEQIVNHFRVDATREILKKDYDKDGKVKSETPIIVPSEFPTFQGFADSIDVDMDTLTEWRESIPEFSLAYARAKSMQEQIWLQNGMSGLYNSQFAMFFGKNCLGYKDKVEVDMSANLGITFVDDIGFLQDKGE